jgi:hypothetical protein
MNYENAIEYLKSLGFEKLSACVCDNRRYGRDGEYTLMSNGTVEALAVNEEGDYYANNCLLLECTVCFNKWSQAPVVARFPCDREAIKKAIDFLSTEEGIKFSKKFGNFEPYEERHPDLSRLEITNVDNLNTIEKLNSLGFEGDDVDLSIALEDYGLVWKKINEDDYLFLYRISSDRNFDRVVMKESKFDKDFDWINEEDVKSYCDLWDKISYPQKIATLLTYYGVENVFGTSYWEGFKIRGVDI